MNHTIILDNLKELTAMQADDVCLWQNESIEAAYVAQALRILHSAIEGDMTFDQAKAAINEMMP